MSTADKLTESFEAIIPDDEFLENFTSIHTRTAYRNDLEQFFSYLLTIHSINDLEKIERLHIIKYRNWIVSSGGKSNSESAPKTIGRKLSAISSYFSYLIEKGIYSQNPALTVKRPRQEVIKPTNALSGEQVKKILAEAHLNKYSGPLHYALMIVFFRTGLRKSEILQLKFRSYSYVNKNRVFLFKGKGGKMGEKLLHSECISALESYIDWMSSQGRPLAPNDFLFQPTRNPKNPSNLNKSLNPKTLNDIFSKYGTKIGLPFKVTPHSARATFITELLNAKIDIYSVAQEVNHSSVNTTQEYDKRRKKLIESPVLKLIY